MNHREKPILNEHDREELEFELFLSAMKSYYGYDFSQYAVASLRRRLFSHMQKVQCQHISQLIPKLLHDPAFFEPFMESVSVTVTSMFRDPCMFKALREKVVPKLKTYPSINIWHAGCATGQEVYSLAILLHEEGLLPRCSIYATDFNSMAIARAREAIYPLAHMKESTENYIQAGGKADFIDYYQARYDSVKFKDFFKKHITFAQHNLMQDQAFAEVQLLLCRNVLIYFNSALQDQVLDMLGSSISHRGFLVLGDRETLDMSVIQDQFDTFDEEFKIYRKRREYGLQ